MTTQEQRIKLAEAMKLYMTNNPGDFNPFEDANDCEAVIGWLNERLWSVMVTQMRGSAEVIISLDAETDIIWTGDNWKHGVCELALKSLPILTTKENT